MSDCSICLDPYDLQRVGSPPRFQRFLVCEHTYCSLCIEDNANKCITCGVVAIDIPVQDSPLIEESKEVQAQIESLQKKKKKIEKIREDILSRRLDIIAKFYRQLDEAITPDLKQLEIEGDETDSLLEYFKAILKLPLKEVAFEPVSKPKVSSDLILMKDIFDREAAINLSIVEMPMTSINYDFERLMIMRGIPCPVIVRTFNRNGDSRHTTVSTAPPMNVVEIKIGVYSVEFFSTKVGDQSISILINDHCFKTVEIEILENRDLLISAEPTDIPGREDSSMVMLPNGNLYFSGFDAEEVSLNGNPLSEKKMSYSFADSVSNMGFAYRHGMFWFADDTSLDCYFDSRLIRRLGSIDPDDFKILSNNNIATHRDSTFSIIDFKTGKVIKEKKMPGKYCRGFVVLPNDDFICSLGGGKLVYLDGKTLKHKTITGDFPIGTIHLLSDNRFALCNRNLFCIYELSGMKAILVQEKDIGDDNGELNSCCTGYQGELIFSHHDYDFISYF